MITNGRIRIRIRIRIIYNTCILFNNTTSLPFEQNRTSFNRVPFVIGRRLRCERRSVCYLLQCLSTHWLLLFSVCTYQNSERKTLFKKLGQKKFNIKMARNEEKAQSMLNRFITLKAEEKKKPKERRPYLASECRDLAEADRWRQQIMREIGRKVAEIQNEGLGEHRLRDLNDEINKLIREKSHWERRIVELGGPNYAKHSAKMTDLEGNIIDVPNPSGRGPGYRYFGAAKKLPGVRELFEKPPELRKRRTRYDIYKRIDASYYGYRDEEDGILEKVEGPAEEEMRMRAVEEWKRMEAIRKEARKGAKEVVSVGVGVGAEVLFEEEEDVVEEERREEREREDIERKEKEREFVVHVPLPDDKEIERMVLEKKKMELLSKYASDSLMEEQTEAKVMLNIQH